MAYPEVTSVNATEGIGELMHYVNDVTNFWLSTSVLIAIWFFVFMGYISTKREDYLGAFTVASFVASVISVLGFLFDFFSGYAVSVLVGLTLIGVAFLLADKDASV